MYIYKYIDIYDGHICKYQSVLQFLFQASPGISDAFSGNNLHHRGEEPSLPLCIKIIRMPT